MRPLLATSRCLSCQQAASRAHIPACMLLTPVQLLRPRRCRCAPVLHSCSAFAPVARHPTPRDSSLPVPPQPTPPPACARWCSTRSRTRGLAASPRQPCTCWAGEAVQAAVQLTPRLPTPTRGMTLVGLQRQLASWPWRHAQPPPSAPRRLAAADCCHFAACRCNDSRCAHPWIPLALAVYCHLEAVVNLLEQYYHPSNSGRWAAPPPLPLWLSRTLPPLSVPARNKFSALGWARQPTAAPPPCHGLRLNALPCSLPLYRAFVPQVERYAVQPAQGADHAPVQAPGGRTLCRLQRARRLRRGGCALAAAPPQPPPDEGGVHACLLRLLCVRDARAAASARM
jgi:hypothetical protein